MTKFNAKNTGYKTKHYPLFLGEDLGFPDSVNVTYPVLEELYTKQLSQIWNEFEIALTQDRLEMTQLPSEIVHPMKLTIMTQTLSDAMASRTISSVFTQHVSNPEMENLVSLWSFFEVIHNRTYAHIIKQTFDNPQHMLEQAYNNERVMLRSSAILSAFDEASDLPSTAPDEEKRRVILKAFTALFGLEAIMFMSSFAVTFAISETGVFQGISKLVELICKDELLHVRMDYEILNILKQDPHWVYAMGDVAADMKEILDNIVSHELQWSDYIFEEGQITGLTPELLKEYVLYMALPVYKSLGIEFSFTEITSNPLLFMEKYIDSTKMQVASQELQSGQYQTGAILEDDLDGLDLSFSF